MLRRRWFHSLKSIWLLLNMLSFVTSISQIAWKRQPDSAEEQECDSKYLAMGIKTCHNKNLGRALDLHANGAWLSKLTQWNMKCSSYEDRELIRRERKDGREARGMREERIEKGSRERTEKRERDKMTIWRGGPESPPIYGIF